MFQKLCTGHILSEREAYALMLDLASQKLNDYQISILIGIFQTRHISLQELNGFKNALLEIAIKIDLHKPCIDVCGTGGDKKNTFNISTLSAIILASAGVPVAKHGNFGASSVSGSSDILKYFGHQFKSNPSELNYDLEKHNICFIHAPLFHPSLKIASPIRKSLGITTFFNLLGPMVNPANPKYRYIGTFNSKIARMYNYMLQESKHHYTIVHSLDGYDEISLTSETKVYSNTKETLISNADFGFKKLQTEDLHAGNTIESAAEIFVNVLQNKGTNAQQEVVLANTALAMNCYYSNLTLTECIAKSKEAIESKKAYNLFKNIINQ
ncbi:MAG: anthranilate phosphoribosyltransferase [Bacteroidota bacterium]|nr:anthranilate phosphoribosyltransferase [Bacteroidota bacterium]